MLNKIKKIYNNQQIKKLNKHSAISRDESSFFLPGSSINFGVVKENRKYVEIGKNCLLNCSFIFESQSGKIEIGNNVHIGGGQLISRSSITIENDVTMAWGITIYDHDSHSLDWEYRKNDNHQCYEDYFRYNANNIVNKDWSHVNSKPIHICSKVWIGFDVTILKGVKIGEGAIIGAKSVVTKEVLAWTVVAGNPARIIKELEH